MASRNYSVRYHGLTGSYSSVTQYGKTFNLDTSYQGGQYTDGSYWILDPGTGVTINSVSPAWDGTKNGSMIDPLPQGESANYQGLDSRAIGYNSSFLQTFPVTIHATTKAKSLLSAIGLAAQVSGGSHETLSASAVLTIVPSVPAADAFRPGFTGGGSKTVYTVSQCNFGLLPGLAVPAGASIPAFSGNSSVLGPFVDFGTFGQAGSELHNNGQFPPYPRDTASLFADMALSACTNTEQAREYANRVIQLGIDLYETFQTNGRGWRAYGGFGLGRKMPIMFAGKLLGVTAMRDLGYVTATVGGHVFSRFGEDGHSFYGATTATYPSGAPMFGRENYGESYYFNHDLRDDRNTPPIYECEEFGSGETSDVHRMLEVPAVYTDPGNYRTLNVRSFTGSALAALILGLKTSWGHDAFFDLCDRCVSEQWGLGTTSTSPWQTDFTKKMWQQYRGSY